MPGTGTARLRSWGWVISVVAVAFPLLRLWPLNGHFGTDWYNHEWLAAYSGEYLRQHGTVPVVINSTQQAGMAVPVFYGTLLYPVLALLTSWLDPGVAVRLMVFGVTLLQFHVLIRALEAVETKLWMARGIACLVIWAVYPLTNLYNRSAITEYIATALLTCVLSSWFLLICAKPEERTRLAFGFGLLLAMTAGVHPITALYSLPVLGLLVVAAHEERGRDWQFWVSLMRSLLAPAALTITILAPWIYALRSLKQYLHINDSGTLPWFYPASIDHWSVRFCPVPYDNRIGDAPLADLSTPYLDAQLNIPLLSLVLGWFLVVALQNRTSRRGGLRAISFGMLAFAFFTWLSLSRSSYNLLPNAARLIQIAYRAVTYSNLGLLLAAFMLLGFLKKSSSNVRASGHRSNAVILIGCITLSGVGVLIKWSHASQTMQVDGPTKLRTTRMERRGWIELPKQFYGVADYTTPSLYRSIPVNESVLVQEETIPIGTGEEFGLPQPRHFTALQDTWIGTNVQAFPWNDVEIDGVSVSDDQVRVDKTRLVVHVTTGEHSVSFKTSPPPVWTALRTLSFVVLALWASAFFYLTAMGRQRRAITARSP